MGKYKYRLSFLQNGKYNSIDLTKLECLKEYKVTDIEIIDKFTSNFQNNKELVIFLIENSLLEKKFINTELNITKDVLNKKSKMVYNEKIYNSNILIFNNDKEKLTASGGIRIIRKNMNNGLYMQLLIKKYKKKYKKLYEENIDSLIVIFLNCIEAFAIKQSRKNTLFSPKELEEYEKSIEEFIDKEIYTSNKKGQKNTNYRGLHDLIILDNIVKNELNQINEKEAKIERKTNFYNTENDQEEADEEFLTKEDFDRVNCTIFGIEYPHKAYELSKDARDKFNTLQENSKKLIKKIDGDC